MTDTIDSRIELEIQMGLSSAEAMGKTIQFPHYHKLSDLFVRADLIPDLHKYKSHTVHTFTLINPVGFCWINSFCGSSGLGPNFDVQPTDEVIDAVERSMLLSDGYVLNFALAIRTGGTALLYTHYNQILGDRWIAILDASTIPGIPKDDYE